MHFSIPDTIDISDDNGTSFKGYNIHINGAFHCTVRYKQLYNLHEQLRKEFGSSAVPFFPPKKLLPLTSSQLEERRLLLEKYIQSIGQDAELVSSELLRIFLLSAQHETAAFYEQQGGHMASRQDDAVTLDIYLMNGGKISVNVLKTDCTERVLTKACKQINLPNEYIGYFALFLTKKEENNADVVMLKKLQDFESPYISHRSMPEPNRIVIRKSYWDSGYDIELMKNNVALGLLYSQTVWDMERGWITCSKEIQAQLTVLQARGAKREYLELARTLKYYGHVRFAPCTCDVPRPDTKMRVSIGQYELCLLSCADDAGGGDVSQTVRETSFRVTRMRCWRITAVHNNNKNEPGGAINGRKRPQLELSFEYLVCKDRLRWVTISSEQAIMMSVCLQSVVDELLLKRRGGERRKNLHAGHKSLSGHSHRHSAPTYTYMKRDGSSHVISLPSDEPNIIINVQQSTNDNTFSIKALQKKFSSVSFKSEREFVENHAFEGIGDDDL